MRTDRLLLPTASITSTRASLVPGISSKLSLRPWAVPFAGRPMRPGDLAFHDARSALAGRPGWHAEFSSAHSRTSRASGTPVASPFVGAALSRERDSWGCLDRAADPSVKMRSASAIRGVFHRRVTPALLHLVRLARTGTDLDGGHVMGFRSDSAPRRRFTHDRRAAL